MQRKQLKESAPRQHNHLPTGAEWRLLEILWEIGDGTVEDVVNAHSPKERQAVTKLRWQTFRDGLRDRYPPETAARSGLGRC
jgi:hypothetical protein